MTARVDGRAPAVTAPTPAGGASDPDGAAPVPSWRDRAVERSLREARARAQDRSNRFLLAASDLLAETGTPDFTVQQLVERTRMSLRSFYQHFGSKDELLLVLFQEGLKGATTEWRAMCEQVDDPLVRLRIVVETLYGSASAGREEETRPMRALALYHLQLADQRPEEFAALLDPLKTMLLEIVAEGVDRGRLRSDLGEEALAVLLLQTLVSATILQLLTDHLTEVPLTPDQLWSFLCPALTGSGAPLPRASTPPAGGELASPSVETSFSTR